MFRLLLIMILSSVPMLAYSLSDPTKPMSYRAVANKDSLRLESIFLGANRKVAVINGKAVSEGDSLDGIAILRINENSVTVSRGGVSSTLTIKRTSIRQEN